MDVGVRFDTNETFVKLQNRTKRFLTNIPEVEAEQGKGIAHGLKEAVLHSIDREGLDWTGKLKSNVKVKASKSGKGGASFNVSANAYNNGTNYAAWHEYAEQSHEAPVSGRVKAWGADKGYLSDWNKYGVQTVEVTPLNVKEGHGFMEPAVKRTIKKARKDIRSGRTPVSKSLRKAYE